MHIYDTISLNTSWGEKRFRTVLEKVSTHFSPQIVQFAKQLQETSQITVDRNYASDMRKMRNYATNCHYDLLTTLYEQSRTQKT